MTEGIELDETFLSTCMNCGGKMSSGSGIYDFYCSTSCETEDGKRIEEMLSEGQHPTEVMLDAFKKKGLENKR